MSISNRARQNAVEVLLVPVNLNFRHRGYPNSQCLFRRFLAR